MNNTGIERTNEKTIKSTYRIFQVIILIFALGNIIAGIVFWANSSDSYYSYYGGRHSYTNDLYVGLGFAFFFGGSFICFLMSRINQIVFGVIFDIRSIRNCLDKTSVELVNNSTKDEMSVHLQNNTAKTNSDMATESANESQNEKTPGDNEWKCPKCGRIKQRYVGTCGCGETQPY